MYSRTPELVKAFSKSNDKGTLLIHEKDSLPFKPLRMFWIRDVPKLARRGGHSHKVCEQFIICTSGGVGIHIDGYEEAIYLDDSSLHGLYVPPTVWIDIRFLRPKTKIVVLCSHEYSEDDYIRDKNEHIAYLENTIQRS